MPFFRDIVGQERALEELRREIDRGRTAHAYLFEGPWGTGRASVARAFAAAVLTENGADEKGLRLFRSQTHPDYLELPRDAHTLRVHRFVERANTPGGESVEHPPVLAFLHKRPAHADRSVCVIPDAERMTEAAANVFLKTLEEPPGDALIVFTAAVRDRLLPTIVSRCRRIPFGPLSVETIAAELERRGAASGGEARALAGMADGSLGFALRLASEEAAALWEWIAGSLGELTAGGAVRFGDGLFQRCAEAGEDAASRRQAALRLLDLVALQLRRAMREGRNPRACAAGLRRLWEAGEQIAANVRIELTLRAAALDLFAILKWG